MKSATADEAIARMEDAVEKFCLALDECKEDIQQFTRFGTASYDDLRNTLRQHWMPRRAEETRTGIQQGI